MTDYWSKLYLKEQWGKKERFNYILNHIDEVSSSGNNSNESQTSDPEKPKDPEVTPTPNPTPTPTASDISVTVLDMDDNPISGATVTVSKNNEEYTCTTGTAGGCTLKNVPLGDCVIETFKDGYVPSVDDFTVVNGENNFTINLDLDGVGPIGESPDMVVEEEELGTLKVTVKNESGDLLEGCTVTLTDDDNEYTGTTNSNGACTIIDIPLGDYSVFTSMEGYSDSQSDDIVISESVHDIVIILKDEDLL